MLTIERVPIPFPTVRCAAPLCGDKIKNGRVSTCWFDGARHYHEFCRDKDGNERREDDDGHGTGTALEAAGLWPLPAPTGHDK